MNRDNQNEAPSIFFTNPFAKAESPMSVPDDAPEGTYAYALIKSEPALNAEEFETSSSSVEIMVRWGESVLHVAHLTPPRSFYVGEEERQHMACDYFLPAERLGSSRAPIILVDGGKTSLVILPGSSGELTQADGTVTSLAALIQSGKTEPCATVAGASMVELPLGAKATVRVDGDIVFNVATVNAGRAIAGGPLLKTTGLAHTALSLLGHAALLGAMAYFMPPLGLTGEGELSSDQTYQIAHLLAAAAEKEQDAAKAVETDESDEGPDGGTGAAAMGSEGSLGSTESKEKGNRYGVAGKKDNPDPHIARAAALEDAKTFGMISMLSGGDMNAPTAAWGREDSSGRDELSANGNMWGAQIGESGGAGGLGLSGIGEGGGGRFEGIGMGAIGTIGNGSGDGTGQGFGPGFARSQALSGGGHKPRPIRITSTGTSVSGRLPGEVIQRIVRQNFGRFRLCYENGLRGNPNLQGRVAVRFIIGRDGSVSNVGNGGSDLPDSAVVSCVVRSFYGLSFPQPEQGIVQVQYPIMFTPGS